MIREDILRTFYDAATIQRWNDHIRPMELTELDKQAHKMIIAFLIAKFEEDNGLSVDWRILIEGGIFEFLQRVVLTDIKPAVFHRIVAEKGDELNLWVLNKLSDIVIDIKGGFLDKFKQYLLNKEYGVKEKKILKASHYLATSWEFNIIYSLSPRSYAIEETKQIIDSEIEQHDDLIGIQKLSYGKKSYGFVDICGYLRFQQRWAQTPRIPKTSVLGHMLIVAMISYLCSVELDACDKRLYNNFFTALFHDLPEALTRDIISPVKKSIEGLDKIIQEYEQAEFNKKILPLLPQSWQNEMRYFLTDEFKSRILNNGKKEFVSSEEINKYFNHDEYSPVDGDIIKVCDHLSAYIEAVLSIEHGIASHHLIKGKEDLYLSNKNKNIAGIHFGQIFDYFK